MTSPMDNEVRITVTSEDNTDAGFRSAEQKGSNFAAKMKGLLTGTGDAWKKTTSHMLELTKQTETWTMRVSEAQGVVDALRKKIAQTGDVSLFGDLGKAEGQLRGLTKFRDSLKVELDKAGRDSSRNFLHGFTDALGSGMSKGILTPQIVGGVAAAAPLVSSVLAGAVTAGVGAGVVGAGLLASAKDARVQGAAAELKNIISLNMQGIAEKTFVPETLKAISFIKGQFRTIRPELERTFAGGAKLVEPITRTLVEATRNLLPGIGDAVDRAGPLFDMLEQRIPRLTSVASDIISDFSKSAEESADTIGGVLTLAEATLAVTGKSLSFLSDNASLLGLGPLQMLGDAMSDNDKRTGEWANTFGDLRKAIEETKQESMDYAETIKAQTDPTYAMIKAQKDLKKAQDEYNEALRDHGKKSPEAQEALLALSEAAIGAQVAAQGLAGEFQGGLTPSMRATLRAAGLTSQQINDLEKQFRDAKNAGDAYAKTYRARVVTEYIGRPFSDFTGIDGSTNRGYAHGGISSAATGGTRSGIVEVGEHGRELVRLPPGAHVMSNPDTERMMSSNGGGSVQVIVSPTPGAWSAFMSEIIQHLQFTVRTEGQRDAQTFFGGI